MTAVVPPSVNLMIPVPDAYTAVEVDGKKIEAANNVVLTNVPKKNGKLKVTGGSAGAGKRIPSCCDDLILETGDRKDQLVVLS